MRRGVVSAGGRLQAVVVGDQRKNRETLIRERGEERNAAGHEREKSGERGHVKQTFAAGRHERARRDAREEQGREREECHHRARCEADVPGKVLGRGEERRAVPSALRQSRWNGRDDSTHEKTVPSPMKRKAVTRRLERRAGGRWAARRDGDLTRKATEARHEEQAADERAEGRGRGGR